MTMLSLRTTPTHEPDYTVIIPRGTRVPTAPDFEAPIGSDLFTLGEPETIFKLVIAEIGHGVEDGRVFNWDASGKTKTGGSETSNGELVVS